MSQSILSRIPFLKPQVVHRLPGRLRIRVPNPPKITGLSLPDINDWTGFVRNYKGIENIDYNPISGKALIIYNPEMISEKTILNAIDRLADVVLQNLPKYLKLNNRTKPQVAGRILNFLAENPFNITSDKPVELNNEIWRQEK